MNDIVEQCKIVSVEVPTLAKTGEGFQIDVRYVNEGEKADTFARMLDSLGNVITRGDTQNHATGDESPGFHIYGTMPSTHYVYLLEVGYGTSMNPQEVTDSEMIVVINTDAQPITPGEIIFDPSINWPIVRSKAFIPMMGAPGQTITRTVDITSTEEAAPVHKIGFNATTKHGSELGPKFTVDGEAWKPSESYDIAGGQTIVFGVTATLLPVMLPDKDYRFFIGLTKLEITGLEPTGEIAKTEVN